MPDDTVIHDRETIRCAWDDDDEVRPDGRTQN